MSLVARRAWRTPRSRFCRTCTPCMSIHGRSHRLSAMRPCYGRGSRQTLSPLPTTPLPLDPSAPRKSNRPCPNSITYPPLHCRAEMHLLGMATGAAVAAVRCVCGKKERDLNNNNKNTKKKGDLNNGACLTRHSSHGTTGGRSFSFEEMLVATRHFSETRVIGFGGHGRVFRGVVAGVDGKQDTEVAIKRANPSPGQSAREFRAEIETLCKVRHRHLVPLLGSCSSNKEGEAVLVYRYMPRGILREHLMSGAGAKPAMPWWRRLDACMGAARGLHCLHAGGVVHGAVKASNVLVDDSWVAKLSDYGLSKGATMESDVHSFGVLLFEVLMAWPGDMVRGLVDYAMECHRSGTLIDAVDPSIRDQVTPECLEKFAETAVECLAGKGTERPAMGDVLWNLELAVQLQLLNSKRT